MFRSLPRAARRVLPVALAAAALLPAAAAAEPLSLIDETQPLGPGIELRHHQFLSETGWTDAQILRVELARPAVSTDLLTAGPTLNDRGPVSKMVADRDATAGVNGDFFDIDGAGGPLNTAIQGGELLKGTAFGRPPLHAGVTKDRLGMLTDAALDASAVLGDETRPVQTFNTSSGAIPPDALVAFTPRWGEYTRARGLQGVPAEELAEAVISGGKVVSVTPRGVGSDPIPKDGFTLVGRGADAEALRALAVGTPAEFRYQLRDEAAQRLSFAIGGNHVLVRDGQAQAFTEPSRAPRTAIGFSADGQTMWLVVADGRQAQVLGPTLSELGELLAGLGADTALNLDGGGSATMVARGLGAPDAAVRNTPSDGVERDDPNGVGVFVAPGDGRVRELVITPRETRVMPGLRRKLTVRAVDSNQTPVEPGRVQWSTNRGSISSSGVLRGPVFGGGQARVRVRAGGVSASTEVRVLGRLDRIALDASRVALPDTETEKTVTLTALDADGYSFPLELDDVRADYDRGVVRLEATEDGVRIKPLREGATVVRLARAGVSVALPVTVGTRTQIVETFDGPNEVDRWRPNGTKVDEQKISMDNGKLRLDYSARRNQGITIKDPAGIPLPGQPLTVRLKLTASNAQQYGSLYWVEADGRRRNKLVGPLKTGAQSVEWTLPADVKFPIAFTQFQTIETDARKQAEGNVIFDALEVDTAPDVDAPAVPPLREDPMVSPDGSLPERGWRFAALSDVQFTAANPELAPVATAALLRIRRDNPDLVVLNGDIIDTGTPADVELARKTLTDGGCDLVKPGEESAPVPVGKVRCLYVPGNHESYAAGSAQGDLGPWSAVFGRPYRTFDHKGTRVVALDSSRGSFRASAFEQLPMLAEALSSAAKDASVRNVLVFDHHPLEDPSGTGASQLGDPLEAKLVRLMLTDFRDRSGKGAAMTSAHAQIADVRRVEGVPYTVLPSSGKGPYGTPDRGGFTGYMRFNVDSSRGAGGPWLTADVRAFAQSVTVEAPERLRPGQSGQVGGSLVQPEGLRQNGTRVVPLRYPMSVRWGGSPELAVGGGRWAARRSGKVAWLDPRTRRIVGLRPGKVNVTVTSESMRTDTADPTVGVATVEVR